MLINQFVNKRDGSEGKRESQSEWQKAVEWLVVSMSREEKEMLGQQKREENVEANCECSLIQSVPGNINENQKKKRKNNTEHASFISTLFLFFPLWTGRKPF